MTCEEDLAKFLPTHYACTFDIDRIRIILVHNYTLCLDLQSMLNFDAKKDILQISRRRFAWWFAGGNNSRHGLGWGVRPSCTRCCARGSPFSSVFADNCRCTCSGKWCAEARQSLLGWRTLTGSWVSLWQLTTVIGCVDANSEEMVFSANARHGKSTDWYSQESSTPWPAAMQSYIRRPIHTDGFLSLVSRLSATYKTQLPVPVWQPN